MIVDIIIVLLLCLVIISLAVLPTLPFLTIRFASWRFKREIAKAKLTPPFSIDRLLKQSERR